MRLYEVSSEIKKLEDLGMEPEQIKDTMESLEMSFNEKANNIANLNENFNGDILAIDEQIKRLQGMKKTIKNKQDSLKEYLRTNMIASGISSIKCELFSITLRKSSKIVDIYDANSLPDDYVNVSTTISPDKNAISKALKDGAEIDGAKLIDGNQALIIK